MNQLGVKSVKEDAIVHSCMLPLDTHCFDCSSYLDVLALPLFMSRPWQQTLAICCDMSNCLIELVCYEFVTFYIFASYLQYSVGDYIIGLLGKT